MCVCMYVRVCVKLCASEFVSVYVCVSACVCGGGSGGRGAKEEENDPIALISSFLVEEEKIHLFPSGHKRRVKRTVHQKTEMDYRELQTSLG